MNAGHIAMHACQIGWTVIAPLDWNRLTKAFIGTRGNTLMQAAFLSLRPYWKRTSVRERYNSCVLGRKGKEPAGQKG